MVNTEISRIKRYFLALSSDTFAYAKAAAKVSTATSFFIILAIANYIALPEKACAQVHSNKADLRSPSKGQLQTKSPQDKQSTVICRRFLQKNPILGEQDVKVIPTAFRVDLKRGGWVQLARAPEWKKVLINEKAKIYCRNEKDNWWQRAIAAGVRASNKEATRKINAKKEKILGMEAKRVTVSGIAEQPPIECFYFEDAKIPRALCEHIAKECGVPHMGGLLLRVRIKDQEGPAAIKFDTLKADTLPVSASQFEIPAGFKEVFSPQEIMLGTGADGLKDFLP